MTTVFIFTAAFLAYILVGYPLLMLALARLRKVPIKRQDLSRPLSVIVCVRDEENVIGARITNLLAMEYPPDRLEIIVVSDGSSDGTDRIVQSYAGGSVKLVRLRTPQGKAAALNAGVMAASHKILLLCDARQRFARDVAKRLVSHFADNSVGAVSGRLVIQPSGESGAAAGVQTYWSYEVWLRTKEAASDSAIGVSGAIYALRKSLYAPLPQGLVLDDVLVPMRVVLKGKRVLYDHDAVAIDFQPVLDQRELRRKVRTLYGNLQLCRVAPELLSPVANRLWLRFVSHKMLRLLLPFLFAGSLVSSLMAGGVLTWIGIGQCLFWAGAAGAWLVGAKSFPWSALSGVLLLNAAAVLAWHRFLIGRGDVWAVASSNIPGSRAGGDPR